MTAALAPEIGKVDRRNRVHFLEEAKRLRDDVFEGTEHAARFRAAVEDDAAFEANASAELLQEPRLAHAALTEEPRNPRSFRSSFRVEARESGELFFAADAHDRVATRTQF